MEVNNVGIKTRTNLDFETAVDRVTAALKDQGFGVITTIDMKATVKKKIDADMEDYAILGACHPESAYQAVKAEKDIGLLLPCNVIVYRENGETVIAAINPLEAMAMVQNTSLEKIAVDVTERLKKVIASFEDCDVQCSL